MIKRLTLLLLGIAMLAQRPGGGGPHPGGNGDGHGDPDSGYTPSGSRGSEAPNLETHLDNVGDTLDRARRPNPAATRPSREPDPNATPRGDRTRAHPTRKLDRPLRRENETADTLAQAGYDVEQNPEGKDNGKNPDYKVEDKYWDCYNPETSNVDRVQEKLAEKVKENQADRLVINMDDSPITDAQLRARLESKPINGLQEIKVVRDGKITDVYP